MMNFFTFINRIRPFTELFKAILLHESITGGCRDLGAYLAAGWRLSGIRTFPFLRFVEELFAAFLDLSQQLHSLHTPFAFPATHWRAVPSRDAASDFISKMFDFRIVL
jgi:hypothetical protein